MGAHHTKDKGDLGVAKVFADLVEKGFGILFPATEHAPFDLVAWDGERFIRVQVKYRSARNGVIKLEFKSTWSDTHGVHIRPMDKASVDVVAIYCPDVDRCFYLDPSRHGGAVSVRLEPTKNCQKLGVTYAEPLSRLPEAIGVTCVDGAEPGQAASSTLVE
jgi:hypothetical protein